MKYLFLIKFICFVYMVTFSEGHTEAEVNVAVIPNVKEASVLEGATRGSIGKSIISGITNSKAAVALREANSARVAAVAEVKANVAENRQILAAADHKAADELSTIASIAAAQVKADSDDMLEDINKAVAKITVVMQSTGEIITANTEAMNVEIIETVKTTTGKVLGDLGVLLGSVQALIDEEVAGIDLIVSNAVGSILSDIKDATCIIAGSTHAALEATKNNVITTTKDVTADVSNAAKNVNKDVEDAIASAKKAFLEATESLHSGAALVAGDVKTHSV